MFPQDLDFHVHLVRDHRRLKFADLLNSVYQLSIAGLYQFTSAADTRSHLGALGVNILIAERCLNHTLGALVDIYDKHDYIEERRLALQKWSDFLVACEAAEVHTLAVAELDGA